MAEDRWFSQGMLAQKCVRKGFEAASAGNLPIRSSSGSIPTAAEAWAPERDSSLLERSEWAVQAAFSEMMRLESLREAPILEKDLKYTRAHARSLEQHKEALDVHGQSAHLEFVTFRDEMQAREQELDKAMFHARQAIVGGKEKVLASMQAVDAASRRMQMSLEDLDQFVSALEEA